jgi:hypothetical protein
VGERLAVNQNVAGSNPAKGEKKRDFRQQFKKKSKKEFWKKKHYFPFMR